MGTLPFVFVVGLSLVRFAQGVDRARGLVDAFLALAILSNTSAEVLGLFNKISFYPLVAVWVIADGLIFYGLWKLRTRVLPYLVWENTLPIWTVTIFVTTTLFIALTAANNNTDSLAYHLPKIEHWLQDGSLAFFPTRTLTQNEFAPLAEILLLQTRVLSGSDIFYPLMQWLSMLISIAAVFRITRQLGGSETQCWIAAVFLVTLPIGILESTTTQNDYVVAAFLTSFITLALEAISRPRASLGLVLAASAAGALTGLVKPTGFVIGAGFALWFVIGLSRHVSLRVWLSRVAGMVVVLVLVLGPFSSRLIAGGHFADLHKMQMNASFGVRQELDNLIRNTVSNLFTGIDSVDAFTVDVSEAITAGLGLAAYRADTSDSSGPDYQLPEGLAIYHEDRGPNQLHMIVIIVAFGFTVIGWPVRPTGRQWLYWGAWLTGVIIFAATMRMQPWIVRLQLPIFAAVTPAVAMSWPERWSHSKMTALPYLLLATASFPVLLFGQSRELLPLWRDRPFDLARDYPSYFSETPLDRLFHNQPWLLRPYETAIDQIVRSNASRIGLVLGFSQPEYPIWSMLRDRQLGHALRIEHVGIEEQPRWPLGPFEPEVLFWNNGEAPSVFFVDGKEFRRVGQPGAVAVYTRAPMQ